MTYWVEILAQVSKWQWRNQTSDNRWLLYCFWAKLWYFNIDYRSNAALCRNTNITSTPPCWGIYPITGNQQNMRSLGADDARDLAPLNVGRTGKRAAHGAHVVKDSATFPPKATRVYFRGTVNADESVLCACAKGPCHKVSLVFLGPACITFSATWDHYLQGGEWKNYLNRYTCLHTYTCTDRPILPHKLRHLL